LEISGTDPLRRATTAPVDNDAIERGAPNTEPSAPWLAVVVGIEGAVGMLLGVVGGSLHGVSPVGFGDVGLFEHHLRSQPSRGDGYGGGVVLGEFVPEAESEPVHGGLAGSWNAEMR
jgi:hypothetical protein